MSHPSLSVRVGLLECGHEPGHECHEYERQPRRPRCETPPEPPPQPAELITEGRPPFRFEDRDFVVVVAAIRGQRSECRLALAAGVSELRPDVLAAEFLLTTLVVTRDHPGNCSIPLGQLTELQSQLLSPRIDPVVRNSTELAVSAEPRLQAGN